jgi:hypothetical protein
MQKYNISNEDLLKYVRQDKYDSYRNDNGFQQINNMISKSYDDILNVESTIIQGTIWDIKKQDVISIEFINREDCNKRKHTIDYRKKYISNLN